jgi:hypothetical protein
MSETIHWQPISALPLIGAMIDDWRDELQSQQANLEACRSRPHVLDNATVDRVLRVYSAQAADVALYEEQLARWRRLGLTPAQREAVDRLAAQLPTIRERIAAILALAEELKDGTIEVVLAKSDVELGLEWLLNPRRP